MITIKCFVNAVHRQLLILSDPDYDDPAKKLLTGRPRGRPRTGVHRKQGINAKRQSAYRKKNKNNPVFFEKCRKLQSNWKSENLERSREIGRLSARRAKKRNLKKINNI